MSKSFLRNTDDDRIGGHHACIEHGMYKCVSCGYREIDRLRKEVAGLRAAMAAIWAALGGPAKQSKTEVIKKVTKAAGIVAGTITYEPEQLREKMAELCHKQWSNWMKHVFAKLEESTKIPSWAMERWRRQAATRYWDLPEDEKESDRIEADKFIELMVGKV